MIIWGIFKQEGTAALAVVDDQCRQVVYTASVAGADDTKLDAAWVDTAVQVAGQPDHVVWVQSGPRPHLKKYLPKSWLVHAARAQLTEAGVQADVSICSTDRAAAAGVFYTSGLGSAAVLSLCSHRDNTTAKIWSAENGSLTCVRSSDLHHSIDVIYRATAAVLGLDPADHDGMRNLARSCGCSADLVHYLICTHFTDEYSLRVSHNHEESIFQALKKDMYLGALVKMPDGRQRLAATILSLIDRAVNDLIELATDATTEADLCLAGPDIMFDAAHNFKFNNIICSPWSAEVTCAVGGAAVHLSVPLNPGTDGANSRRRRPTR